MQKTTQIGLEVKLVLQKITQKKLEIKLALHKKWLDSSGKEGKSLDLSGKNVSGLNFSNSDCRGVNFIGANCEGAKFSNSNCRGVNFTVANCKGAVFEAADCRGVNFTGANLLRANCKEANLSRANLSRANLSRANLSRANLTDAFLEETSLVETTFTNSNLYKAKSFYNCNISKLIFEFPIFTQTVAGNNGHTITWIPSHGIFFIGSFKGNKEEAIAKIKNKHKEEILLQKEYFCIIESFERLYKTMLYKQTENTLSEDEVINGKNEILYSLSLEDFVEVFFKEFNRNPSHKELELIVKRMNNNFDWRQEILSNLGEM